MARQPHHALPVASGPSGKLANGGVIQRPPTLEASPMQAADQLQKEILRLVEASREGRLTERGRAELFEGNDRKLVEGVNEMLDAILLPIGEGTRIMAQMSTGKIDELIAQTYKGDHEKMKQAVNNVGIALQNLLVETAML